MAKLVLRRGSWLGTAQKEATGQSAWSGGGCGAAPHDQRQLLEGGDLGRVISAKAGG